jgi:signal peptidase II
LPPDTEGAPALTSSAPADPAAGPAPVVVVRPHRSGLRWWLCLGVIALDQITKAAVVAMLPLYDSRPIIPGMLDLVHVHNAGVAFGILNDVDHPQKWILTTALALAALFGITLYARHIRPNERLARVGLSLILGGALGNLLDRLRQSYVVDFVDVYWRGWHFWAFNVADAAITIGAVLVFVELLLVNRHASDPV